MIKKSYSDERGRRQSPTGFGGPEFDGVDPVELDCPRQEQSALGQQHEKERDAK